MKYVLQAAGLALAGLCATGAQAAPAMKIDKPETSTAIEHVQGWRYHRNCAWRGGRWVVDVGAGRVVVCRPNRPGRAWVWRDEGPRHGWYHPRERRWFYDRW